MYVKQSHQSGLRTLCPVLGRLWLESMRTPQETQMKATLALSTEHCGLSTRGWSIPKSGWTRPAKPRISPWWEAREDLCLLGRRGPPLHSAPPEFRPPERANRSLGLSFLTCKTGVTLLSSFHLRQLNILTVNLSEVS